MKNSIFLVLLTTLMFFGCSTKINMAEFRNKAVSKDDNAPKKYKNIEHIGAVVKFNPKYFNGNNLAELAQTTLIENLNSSGLLKKLDKINSDKINEYAKFAEIEKESGEENILYHLIIGKLIGISITDNGTYHPPVYDKKGKLIKKSCYSYEVCAQMNVIVLSLPSKNIEFEKTREHCEDTCEHSSNRYIVNRLASSVVQYIADDLASDIRDVFTPMGYVYEYKENKDHEIIAHITLGANNGIKQDMTVYFYKIKKDSLGKKTFIKVGEGKVSQIIAPDNAWVVVKFNKQYQPKIGYVVIPDVSSGFFSNIIGSIF